MSYVIETHQYSHDGFDIRIDVVPDEDSTPYDDDCYDDADRYDDADVEAWRNDEWSYVGYIYTASRHGVELGTASIWGSEWDFPGTDSSIAAWIREDYYHPDLQGECVADARATLAKLQNSGEGN